MADVSGKSAKFFFFKKTRVADDILAMVSVLFLFLNLVFDAVSLKLIAVS